MTTPFIFFEFDASLLQKYYGNINSPGIYAIPEDEVEPHTSDDEEENKKDQNQNLAAGQEEDEMSSLEQRDQNRNNIAQSLTNNPYIQYPQMSADEQQAFDQEIEPIKRVYLLMKLEKLSKILKDNSLMDDDLELILKYGNYLTYNTLRILAISVINNLKVNTPQIKSQQEVDPAVQQQLNNNAMHQPSIIDGATNAAA